MRRLLVVTDYDFPTGGIEEMVYEFTDFASRSYECWVLSWGSATKLPSNLSGHVVVDHGDVSKVWEALAIADAVLVVTSFNVRILAALVAEFLKESVKPAVVVVQTSSHSSPSSLAVERQSAWLRDLISCAQPVAVSLDVADALAHHVGGDPGLRSPIVIENASRLSSPGRRRNRTNVLFVGRPHPQKGWSHFERLALEPSLRELGLEFHANTVSVGADVEHEGITYSMQLDDVELIELFDWADVLVAPYLRSDGLPLAVAEAIGCRLPIIGYDSPGLGYVLRRANQHVVSPRYGEMLAAIEAWAAGDLTLTAPAPSSVADWERQSSLLLDALATEAARV